MGAYAYCGKCGDPLPRPALDDAIVGYMECPECDHPRQLSDHEKRAAVDMVADALVELFKALNGRNP